MGKLAEDYNWRTEVFRFCKGPYENPIRISDKIIVGKTFNWIEYGFKTKYLNNNHGGLKDCYLGGLQYM